VSYYQRHGRIRRSFVYSHSFDGSSPDGALQSFFFFKK